MRTQIVNLFRRNLLKKIIALVVAFLMWVFVMAEQDPAIDGSYVVPLTISNATYDLIPVCDDKTIRISARAPRSNFVKYDANAFRVYANLEGLGEGDHQITPQVIMPQGFELIETYPATIKVKLDSSIEKQIPIELITVGAIAPDSAIKDIRKSMDFVTVVGPKSYVERVTRVYSMINFSGNTSSFEMQIPMRAVDEKENPVSNVRVVPSVITVSVDIESGLKKKIVPVVSELTAPDDWELTKVIVEPAQVEITGAESVINSIITIKTEPFTVQTGQRTFKGDLRLDVPEGVTVKSDEVTITAEVVRKPVAK